MFYPIEMFTRKIFVYEHRISPRSLGFRNSDDIHKIGFPLCSVCQSVWDSRMGPGIKTTVKICHLDSRYMFRTLTLFLVSVYIYCNWDNLGWIDLFFISNCHRNRSTEPATSCCVCHLVVHPTNRKWVITPVIYMG
jgi:hypothetical protein